MEVNGQPYLANGGSLSGLFGTLLDKGLVELGDLGAFLRRLWWNNNVNSTDFIEIQSALLAEAVKEHGDGEMIYDLMHDAAMEPSLSDLWFVEDLLGAVYDYGFMRLMDHWETYNWHYPIIMMLSDILLLHLGDDFLTYLRNWRGITGCRPRCENGSSRNRKFP